MVHRVTLWLTWQTRHISWAVSLVVRPAHWIGGWCAQASELDAGVHRHLSWVGRWRARTWMWMTTGTIWNIALPIDTAIVNTDKYPTHTRWHHNCSPLFACITNSIDNERDKHDISKLNLKARLYNVLQLSVWRHWMPYSNHFLKH